ncbi:tyrosine-type recombinase/integrase [Aestuariivirga sp.]|uniref:tyrosine-type recombinase/integrase n=1 Tax=Aestuariivirga sp. TaxID=2650926 RepID=UPI003BAB0068
MPTLKLTKTVIDDLRADATDQVYWDKTLRGFGLKITPAGRKVFIVMYRTTDSRRQLRKYTLGPYGTLTLFMARAAAQKIMLARLDGQDPAAEKQSRRKRPSSLSLELVIQQYKAEYLEPRGVGKETMRILMKIVLARWSGRQIDEITKGDVRDCIDAIISRGAPAMAGRAFKAIRAFFKWCVGRGLMELSPCAGLMPPPTGRSRDRVLSDEELGCVLSAAMSLPHPFGSIVKMLALTGQRRSEVAGMRWNELDLDKGIWTIPARRTKNRRAHIVHLTPPMLSLLPRAEDDQPLVFATAQGKIYQYFSITKKRLDSASGVTGWVLHDLRRTVATGMAGLGVAPHVADKILNHQSGTISGIAAIYQRHEFLAERKAASELWSQYVDESLNPLSTEHPKH